MTGDSVRPVRENAPLICVMGVSAAGKSTVGTALAETLGLPYLDADSLHSAANRSKMNAGTPLTDDDRWSWLDAVGASFGAAADTGLVLACSALKRVYRDRIRAVAPGVVFVHLDGSRELLRARVSDRTDHFMPAELLDSQFATLESLDSDEAGFVVDVAGTPAEIVNEIIERLGSAQAHLGSGR